MLCKMSNLTSGCCLSIPVNVSCKLLFYIFYSQGFLRVSPFSLFIPLISGIFKLNSIFKQVMPSENMSPFNIFVAWIYDFSLSKSSWSCYLNSYSISGAAYGIDNESTLLVFNWVVVMVWLPNFFSTSLDIPKSVIQYISSSIFKIFSGLMSRWIMPTFLFKKRSPNSVCSSIFSTSSSLNFWTSC